MVQGLGTVAGSGAGGDAAAGVTCRGCLINLRLYLSSLRHASHSVIHAQSPSTHTVAQRVRNLPQFVQSPLYSDFIASPFVSRRLSGQPTISPRW